MTSKRNSSSDSENEYVEKKPKKNRVRKVMVIGMLEKLM